MESVEAEGETVESATESALLMLGVARDRVDIEVIGGGSRGLLGFGSRRARIRATVRPEGAAPAVITRPAPPAPRDDYETEDDDKPTRRAAVLQRSESEAPVDAALAEKARGVLQEIISQIGAEATVNLRQEDESVVLDIAGDGSGLMIGRRGQMLDALEYVLNRIVLKDQSDAVRLVVDSENYRARRRESLEQMAVRMAAQAKQRKRPVTLNPMSPRDRRIVHLALQGDTELTTKSSGEGFYRKLVILPKGVTLGRGRDRGRGPQDRRRDGGRPAS